jgi:DNA-binding MarR family transcriptional regulator
MSGVAMKNKGQENEEKKERERIEGRDRIEGKEKYLQLVPWEIRHMVTGLSDDRHWAVYLALLENERMTFREIRDEFGFHQQTVSNLLRDLAQTGFVMKRSETVEDMADRRRGYYQVTRNGKRFIKCLMDEFLPAQSAKKRSAPDDSKPVPDTCHFMTVGSQSRDESSELVRSATASGPRTVPRPDRMEDEVRA